MEEPEIRGSLHCFDYADGCFYWTLLLVDRLLVLDVFRMEFSIINTSHRMEDNRQVCVVVDREGTPGMLTIGDYIGNGLFRLSHTAKQGDHESPCLSENIIQLPSNYNYFTLGAAEGFMFLLGYPEDQKISFWMELKGIEYYLLNVKTAELKKICVMNKCFFSVHRCFFGFPPSLSKPCLRRLAGLPTMASPSPLPSSASHQRRSQPPSPAASSVGSSPAFPPRKRRKSGRPPPFLGLACYDGFYPATEPHPSAKRAIAVARKADFEYDFVPWVPEEEAWGWFPVDARDGRVLIQSKYFPDDPDGGGFPRPRFMNYAVCDPLFKRYVMLPSIPDDLTVNEGSLVNFGLCLAPSHEDEVDTSFRVICVARYNTKLLAFVFSSVTRQWGIGSSSTWSSLGTEEPPNRHGLSCFDCVDGCFYWTVPSADKILVLDALKMEFSIINYAHRVEDGFRACIAVDREGIPGMLTVGEYLGNGEFRFSRIAKQSDRESPNERLLENIIQLPSYHNKYFTLGAAEGFIFLRGIPEEEKVEDSSSEDLYMDPEEVDYYSLNVKTAEFKMVCAMDMDKCYYSVCPYFRFSPTSAKPCGCTFAFEPIIVPCICIGEGKCTPAVGCSAMASLAPASASHRRRARPPSPTASSVASSAAFPPRKRRRSGRPPPLLGLVCDDGFYPTLEPHPSAKRALAVGRKADFEFHFVPPVPKGAWGWLPLDARDGRVLIRPKFFPRDPDGGDFPRPRFMSYAVCDPLFKRYVLLPPIPDDLTVNEGNLVDFAHCLAPSQEDEADTSFRVICVARYNTKLVAFVFSSVTRQWGIGSSSTWNSLGTEEPPNRHGLSCFDCVDGCFYWTVPSADKILVLDALKMEFSVINYAHRVEDGLRACVAVDKEGTPGMLTVGEYLGNGEFRFSRIAKQSDRESPNERLSENIIQLPSYYSKYFTLGAAEGFIFLRGIPEEEKVEDSSSEDLYMDPEEIEYYSLNVKTAEFEMVCAMDMDKCYFDVCPDEAVTFEPILVPFIRIVEGKCRRFKMVLPFCSPGCS
uniref:F-box protein AT5G49610-like beta-propeller domain-containing protein n=1 Tax=Oryza punctata TaxID=4537 RepID=A0A0E0LM35_ORYPU